MLTFSMSKKAPPIDASLNPSNADAYTKVVGTFCQMCNYNIGKALHQTEKLDKFYLNMDTHMLFIRFKDGTKMSAKEIGDALLSAGYKTESEIPEKDIKFKETNL